MIKPTWSYKYPHHFEKNLVKEDEAKLFMAINAINGVKANLGGAYLRTIIQDYNQRSKNGMDPVAPFQPGNTDRSNIVQLVQPADEL